MQAVYVVRAILAVLIIDATCGITGGPEQPSPNLENWLNSCTCNETNPGSKGCLCVPISFI